jgi:hypothetical protein
MTLIRGVIIMEINMMTMIITTMERKREEIAIFLIVSLVY